MIPGSKQERTVSWSIRQPLPTPVKALAKLGLPVRACGSAPERRQQRLPPAFAPELAQLASVAVELELALEALGSVVVAAAVAALQRMQFAELRPSGAVRFFGYLRSNASRRNRPQSLQSQSTAGMVRTGSGSGAREAMPPPDGLAELGAVSAPAGLEGRNIRRLSPVETSQTRRGMESHRHREISRRSTETLWRRRDLGIVKNHPPRFRRASKDGSWSVAQLRRA